jgi:hypothetical protein
LRYRNFRVTAVAGRSSELKKVQKMIFWKDQSLMVSVFTR